MPMIRNKWVEPLHVSMADDPGPDVLRGMGRFNSFPSAEFRGVVRSLRDLEEAEGEAEEAAAEVLQHQRHDLLVQTFGKPYWFEGCVVRALGRGRGHDCDDEQHNAPGHGRCLPPGTDHPRLLRRDGKTVWLLIQPYDVSWIAMQGLVNYCRRYQLNAQIVGAMSYHYPSRTVAIVITPNADDVPDWLRDD